MPRFREQLQRHSVAIISLFVAVCSLAYNTWRNEASEENRNIRTAGIELLVTLGELDRTLLHAQWGVPDSQADDTFMHVRSGWAYVLTIRDLGRLVPEPAATSTAGLHEDWQAMAGRLGDDDTTAFDTISSSIDKARNATLSVLDSLD